MKQLKSVGVTALAAVLALTWWSFRGSDGDALSGIPSKVWDGGGGTVSIEVEVNAPSHVRAAFEEVNTGDGRFVEASQAIGAGRHAWTVDVPRGTYASFEVAVDNAQPGATAAMSVKIGDRIVWKDSDTLREPLPANYAFVVGCDFEDVLAGRLATD